MEAGLLVRLQQKWLLQKSALNYSRNMEHNSLQIKRFIQRDGNYACLILDDRSNFMRGNTEMSICVFMSVVYVELLQFIQDSCCTNEVMSYRPTITANNSMWKD